MYLNLTTIRLCDLDRDSWSKIWGVNVRNQSDFAQFICGGGGSTKRVAQWKRGSSPQVSIKQINSWQRKIWTTNPDLWKRKEANVCADSWTKVMLSQKQLAPHLQFQINRMPLADSKISNYHFCHHHHPNPPFPAASLLERIRIHWHVTC